MSSRPEPVGPELLRGWGLPDPGDSKKARGDVVIVGGSRSAPGAALLAGEAALRVGAGRVALAVPASIDAQVGVALPESGVVALPDDADDPFEGDLRDHVARADVVLVGPGFDDPAETRATLLAAVAAGARRLVLDAFALGVLPEVERNLLPRELVLSPNKDELGILLDRDLRDEATDVVEAARRFDAVVGCYGMVAHPDGRLWHIDEGGAGLGTSGSGDVLAGAIAGFVARGMPIERAAVWGGWAHARAGSRLEERVGLGFLARDLTAELTPTVRDTLEQAD
ncbi:NAD(P)H-hydrate dehydratase [Microbacterium sp. CFH 31415]|uniref:NAD(P)H-hydrate dehydratase n=1 Tax=Microbacterium sp. CFH 31415 TaxID=2921732 RepID=UPI001F133425|nr:NAD(P)H-hydrate dehydratase [Microbacterium sp. CFH 31415]MCH6230350.1 NAD(P)H-hydrate dehydratase [Microbacterium sp. CFH 31415]